MMLGASLNGDLFPAVWKLLRLRVRLSINSFLHSRRRTKVIMVIALLGLLALAVLLFMGSWGLLNLLRSPQFSSIAAIDTQPLLRLVPVVLLSGLFVGILLTSFGVLLQGLYLAGDMDFLLASPVPIRAVFITKLLQAVLPNLGLFALFGLPLLFGLGVSSGYSAVYYPLVVLVIMALTMAAAGIASLLVMAVVRVLPARRAAEILGFIGATAGVLCGQSGNFSRWFVPETGFTPNQLSSATALLSRFTTPWLPLNWAGLGLVNVGEGRWLPGTLLVVLTLGLASLVFWFALETAERLYYSGWAGMQVVVRKSKRVPARRPAAAPRGVATTWIGQLLPSPVRAVVVKDALLMRRDLRHLSQLISPLIVGVVFSMALVRSGGNPPPGQGEAPAWFMEAFRVLLGYGNAAVALFVGWILLSRLAGMGFSQEGKSFWMLKTSPLTPRDLLAAKFLVAYLPAAALGSLFVVGIDLVRGLPLAQAIFVLPVVLLCLAGADGVLLGFGAAGANFKWEDPRRMNAGGMGCLGQVVTMAIMPINFACFVAPPILAIALRFPEPFGYAVGLVLGSAVSFLAAFLPLRLAEPVVQRLDES